MLTAVSITTRLVHREARAGSGLVVGLVVVILERRLLAWLWRVLGIGRDVLATILLLLLHLLVVGDVTGIGPWVSFA